ncbi:MAG: DNA polymerase IV [Eikenella sp.]|nr:DNA polymerase IV [Eikenella sp.]
MSAPPRKIIHIDMDAFFASVELLRRPELRSRPVVVAWEGVRSVVCAANYEARKFGIRSAMALAAARRRCPQLVCLPPDFARYRAVSAQIHGIFRRHTDVIEPLSLDEAYLDVSSPLSGHRYARDIAQAIRAEIRAETGLTASAGVAPNKLIAKIASDWRKPNGQTVVSPEQVLRFLHPLPPAKIPGVGKVTAAKMADLGIRTIADMAQWPREHLVLHFGRYGHRLYDLARGIDERPVRPEREYKQVSVEHTLAQDVPLAGLLPMLPGIAEEVWRQLVRKRYAARRLTLKLKTADFQVLTRSATYSAPFARAAELAAAAAALSAKLPPERHYRLVGIGVSHLQDIECQPVLWQEEGAWPADGIEAT